MQDASLSVHSELTQIVLGSCFDVINELGSGFLESVYENALTVALTEKRIRVETQKRFDVLFRGQTVGQYYADLIVEGVVIVELKCCARLLPEHQAQVINYLTASGVDVGLLVNFGNPKLEYKRLHHRTSHRCT